MSKISDAYASGRLTAAEFDHRSGQALSARTHGELDHALDGLRLPDQPRARFRQQVAFWTLAPPLSALVLFGVLLVAFGAEADDRFGGLVLVIALVPVIFGLQRWAWPRST